MPKVVRPRIQSPETCGKCNSIIRRNNRGGKLENACWGLKLLHSAFECFVHLAFYFWFTLKKEDRSWKFCRWCKKCNPISWYWKCVQSLERCMEEIKTLLGKVCERPIIKDSAITPNQLFQEERFWWLSPKLCHGYFKGGMGNSSLGW